MIYAKIKNTRVGSTHGTPEHVPVIVNRLIQHVLVCSVIYKKMQGDKCLQTISTMSTCPIYLPEFEVHNHKS